MPVARFARRTLTPALSLACVLVLSQAHADRLFGSVAVTCDSFNLCGLRPEMPEPPSDPALLQLQRAGAAKAPLEVHIYVNKPVEGGVPIRLELGAAAFELQPGNDVLTRRQKSDGGERVTGYWIAESRVPELLEAMRRTENGRLKLAVAGEPQERAIRLDGMDAALRYLDERQGRAGAQDALIDTGTRAPADAPAPQPLPSSAAWPKEIARIFKREKCQHRLASFDALTTGFIASPGLGRELWQIACWGGNYNILFILVDIRNGDPKTARVLTFPTRLRKSPSNVAVNPVWWDARKEIWTFDRGRAFGDCGTVARYRWTERGFALADERRKEHCDDKLSDPWTEWPVTQPGRGLRR